MFPLMAIRAKRDQFAGFDQKVAADVGKNVFPLHAVKMVNHDLLLFAFRRGLFDSAMLADVAVASDRRRPLPALEP